LPEEWLAAADRLLARASEAGLSTKGFNRDTQATAIRRIVGRDGYSLEDFEAAHLWACTDVVEGNPRWRGWHLSARSAVGLRQKGNNGRLTIHNLMDAWRGRHRTGRQRINMDDDARDKAAKEARLPE
jgi:hypothetical protein